MGDSFNKKEREKQKQKKKKEKEERRKERQETEGKSTDEFVYLDEEGNLTSTPPDPGKKKQETKLEDIVLTSANANEPEEPSDFKSGTVKFFDPGKGYGFIVENRTKKSYFVHVSDLVDQIADNNKVKFKVEEGPKGKVAKAVTLD